LQSHEGEDHYLEEDCNVCCWVFFDVGRKALPIF
jgi:hypothetical protein